MGDISLHNVSDSLSFFIKDFQKFMSIFQTSIQTQNGVLTWRWEQSGSFTVQSTYAFLTHPGLIVDDSLWRIRLPEKIKIFLWLIRMDRLLTQQNLIKRNWPHLQSCVMCKMNTIETSSHLFLHCRLARLLWSPSNPQVTMTAYEYWITRRKLLPATLRHD
jgi:zinc-binding in reverse transcriptase